MTKRKLLLATLAGAAVLAAFASQALPLNTQGLGQTAANVLNIDYRKHDDDGHRKGHHGHDDDGRRYAANDCSQYGDDDDDDDDGAACGPRGASMQQNATPPSNGLFMPGSKPRAQMN